MRIFAEMAKESSQAIAEQRRQNSNAMDDSDPGRPFPEADTPMRSVPTPQYPSGREQSEIKKVTQTAWDNLRQNNPPSRTGGATAPMSGRKVAEDERTKERREFDEMLERERRGVDSEQKWG